MMRRAAALFPIMVAGAGKFRTSKLHKLYYARCTYWKLFRLYNRIFCHPLNANSHWSALNRFLKWKIVGSIAGMSTIVPYVDETKLVVTPDSSAAILTIYIGLAEFEDMSFMLHLLTDEDLFGDVGANVGVYCVLASGVRGARSVVMEPVATTIEELRLNVAINEIGALVEIFEIAIGAEPGELYISTDEGCSNHVVQNGSGCRVPVLPLDEVFAARTPTLIKIDVEGFETNVIKGAQRLLNDTALKAVLIEMNGSGKRFGFDERTLDNEMHGFGFNSFEYDPFSRKLMPTDTRYLLNTLYVRDLAYVEHRLKAAKPFRVLDHQL